jgi:Protein of unknown function (DUF3667)
VSHFAERKEKSCLNCNALVNGRFCHICGQENIEPKESMWHLISHFFKDITHFDGKFFSSLKLLVTRPGFLPREYMLGRRASYLNPIRMYVFTSAFFFLVFFSIFNISKDSFVKRSKLDGVAMDIIEKMDSASFDAFTKKLNIKNGKGEVPMSREALQKYFDSSMAKKRFTYVNNKEYESKAQYDSLVKNGVVKDSWVERLFMRKSLEINDKYKKNPQESLGEFANIFIHSLPQMLFISLPLFALLLRLLYIRRKNFYYVSHGIFSIHFYIFVFIILLLLFGLSKLNSMLDFTIIRVIQGFIITGIFFYLYKGMRNFYGQGRAKTVIKFFLLFNLLLFVMFLIFIVFILFSFFKI